MEPSGAQMKPSGAQMAQMELKWSSNGAQMERSGGIPAGLRVAKFHYVLPFLKGEIMANFFLECRNSTPLWPFGRGK